MENKIILTDDRKKQIGEVIFQNPIRQDSLQNFSVQEIIYALRIYNYFNEKSPVENYDKNYNILKNQLILSIIKAEYVYMTNDKRVKFPFINMGSVDIYSNKIIACEAIEHYTKKYRDLELKKVALKGKLGELNITTSDYLFCLGIERVRLDTGWYSIELDLNEIFNNQYKAEQVLINPKLRFAMIDFLEEINWAGNYIGKNKVVKDKEKIMLNEIKQGRYILPVQIFDNCDVLNENNSGYDINFARLKNNDGKFFTPIFTDWIEFGKKYNKNEWKGLIVNYNNLKSICINCSGVVINPLGEKVSIYLENL